MARGEPPDDLWTTISRIEAAAADARRRLARRSPGWWRGAARSGRRRCDVVADLVAFLAAADPTAEGRTPRRPARDAVLADQLAVVAYDLTLQGADAGLAEAIERAMDDVD